MGLIGNWIKRKKTEQLKSAGVKTDNVEIVKEIAAGKAEKTKKKIEKTKDTLPDLSKITTNDKAKLGAKMTLDSVAYRILRSPLVTEKSAIAESVNKYSFIVAANATKTQIKKAIKDLYNIDPVSINVANYDGRQVRFGKNRGRRSDYKKAIISLPSGKSIDLHKGV